MCWWICTRMLHYLVIHTKFAKISKNICGRIKQPYLIFMSILYIQKHLLCVWWCESVWVPFKARAGPWSSSDIFSHNSPSDRARELIELADDEKHFLSIKKLRHFWFLKLRLIFSNFSWLHGVVTLTSSDLRKNSRGNLWLFSFKIS